MMIDHYAHPALVLATNKDEEASSIQVADRWRVGELLKLLPEFDQDFGKPS